MANNHTKRTTSSPKRTPFSVVPVRACHVAQIVLEELSRDYAHVCNYLSAAELAGKGEVWLAYEAVRTLNSARPAHNAESTWVQAQAEGALKKLVDPEYDRWPATQAKWFATEHRCYRLNQKFSALTARHVRGVKGIPFLPEITRFRDALKYALGDEPPIEDIIQAAHYGPGSSTDVRGSEVHYARKIESSACVPTAVELGARSLALDKAVWEMHGLRPEYANGNADAYEGAVRVIRESLQAHVTDEDRLLFIHKGIESMRSIGAQPTVSGHLQLGVHALGVQILKRVGIDLDDQTRNQKLAYLGSLHHAMENPWCTLDKTDASSLIANGLIQIGFPPAWCKLLQRLRTPRYEAPREIGGGSHTYQMYAGMGNGTTFFVETLVFWAATYAASDYASPADYVQERPYAIYGDDVVLRRGHALAYMAFGAYLGFQYNFKKTFLDGPFRESCGCDYYAGVNVRPAILNCETEYVSMTDIVALHNTLADQPFFPLHGATRRLRAVWKKSMYPLLPTDPSGSNGFRPTKQVGGYDIVRNSKGTPLLSEWWQRPRFYVMDVRAKLGSLGAIGVYTQLAVAAMRARQEGEHGQWKLPLRDNAVNIRIVPERDMVREDLVQMVTNQLAHLAARKSQDWYPQSRGL